MIKRKLILIMENKPGALVRVVGLFHQRGYNIESLHVDPVDDFSQYKFIEERLDTKFKENEICLLYTSPSPRDQRGSRMPACA